MYQHILVPVDGSATSTQGLDEAVKLARLTGATLRLVHVVNELAFASGFEIYTADIVGLMKEGGEQILAEAKTRVEAAGVGATTWLCENFGGRISDVVVEEAKRCNADLIVIGSHGRRGVGRLVMGSDAEQILRSSTVPVLLVRAVATSERAQAAAVVPPVAVPA